MANEKLKVGRKVNVVSSHSGNEYTGKITEIKDSGARGAWYVVETGDRKNSVPKTFRASELTPA